MCPNLGHVSELRACYPINKNTSSVSFYRISKKKQSNQNPILDYLKDKDKVRDFILKNQVLKRGREYHGFGEENNVEKR